jgi:hypothetical protein
VLERKPGHKLAYLSDTYRFLRSVRLALHPAQLINQKFPELLFNVIFASKTTRNDVSVHKIGNVR